MIMIKTMGKYADASKRTPGFSSNTFKNDDVFVSLSSFLKFKEYGLYANRQFVDGDVIQEYVGVNKTHKQALQTVKENKKSQNYMFEVGVNNTVHHVIDGSNSKLSSAARYANSTKTWKNKIRNAEYKQFKRRIYLVASKDIDRNEEIISFYGEKTGILINS